MIDFSKFTAAKARQLSAKLPVEIIEQAMLIDIQHEANAGAASYSRGCWSYSPVAMELTYIESLGYTVEVKTTELKRWFSPNQYFHDFTISWN